MPFRPLQVVATAALLAACSSTPAPVDARGSPSRPSAHVPAGARSAASAARRERFSAPDPAPPAPPPPALQSALDGAMKGLATGDMATADRQLAAALVAAETTPTSLPRRARSRLAFIQVGDFERAAAAFLAVIPASPKHPSSRTSSGRTTP